MKISQRHLRRDPRYSESRITRIARHVRAMERLERALGFGRHALPRWRREVEVDGVRVSYAAHADPAIASLMDEIVTAAYRSWQAGTLPGQQSSATRAALESEGEP